MSTDLYGVRVIGLDPPGRRIRLRVFVVSYATVPRWYEPLPDDPSFFVRALRERAAPDSPLDEAIPTDRQWDEKWIDAHTWRFVDRVERLSTRHYPVTDEHIDTLFAVYYERGGCWADEDRLVQADYDVWVTDPRWLSSCVLGDSRGSAAYATKSDPPPPAAARRAANRASADAAAARTREMKTLDRTAGLDHALMRRLAVAAPLAADELDRIRAGHTEWLASGGGDSRDPGNDPYYATPWESVSAAGFIIAVYTGPTGLSGQQASLRLRHLDPATGARGLRLPWADLSAVSAPGVDLSGADLRGCAVTDADLAGARLSGTDLRLADLSRADLRGADLTGADLRRADCENADLTGADLTGARIGGLRLAGALVTDVRGFGTDA